jgi:hypothetical protein
MLREPRVWAGARQPYLIVLYRYGYLYWYKGQKCKTVRTGRWAGLERRAPPQKLKGFWSGMDEISGSNETKRPTCSIDTVGPPQPPTSHLFSFVESLEFLDASELGLMGVMIQVKLCGANRRVEYLSSS